jgi:protein-S-isoprenylcysteine O-methyltransferase Ste14
VNPQVIGPLLVALQFALVAAVAAPAAKPFAEGLAGAVAWLFMAAGLGLGLWALACNRPGNFNIRPTPREGGQLVQSGPYRWIRHPMYSAVLLMAAACAWVDASAWAWLTVGALTVVLMIKAGLEERWMAVKHPGYTDYCRRSRRFLPGIF